jgi:hypothetical protein
MAMSKECTNAASTTDRLVFFHVFRDVDAIDSESTCSSSEFLYEAFFYAALFGHIAHVKVRRASIDQQQSQLEIQSRSACLNSKGFHEKLWNGEWRLGYPVVFQIRCSPSQLPHSLLCPDVASATSPYFQLCCRYHPLSLDHSIHVIAKMFSWFYEWPEMIGITECQTCSRQLPVINLLRRCVRPVERVIKHLKHKQSSSAPALWHLADMFGLEHLQRHFCDHRHPVYVPAQISATLCQNKTERSPRKVVQAIKHPLQK